MSKDIEGLDEALKNLHNLFGKSPVALEKSLTKVSNHILAEAIQICPVKEGTLRRSGKVTNLKTTFLEVSNEIRFDTDYAVYVHERLDLHHPVGQAKFLETALNATAPDLAKEVATGYRSELKL